MRYKTVRMRHTTYGVSEIWRVLNDHIQAAVTNDMTPKEALKEAQKQAEEILEEYE